MNWTTEDELVGQRVMIQTAAYEEETGVVVAVRTDVDLIKVRADEDGLVLIGNQWEPME